MTGISPYKARLLAENRIRWQFGVNDPSFGGWATTAGYGLAAWAVLLAARRAAPRSFDRRFWCVLGVFLVAMGINKQLDLHVLLIDLGRSWAIDHGWYQQRRAIQSAFIIAAGITGILTLAGAAVVAHRRAAMVRLALLGAVFTAGYVSLRAAAFNHADSFLTTEIAGMRWDWIVEVAGIALIAVAAWRYGTPRR